ncbi:TRM11 family methyltransferase [Metamycoplasma hominis]|uniref:50S ribosomal protein L11 methyltransferase n=1 Tax=Metamycoplasma hominis TaxID=2098 RepID=UPI0015887893|nr:50S ribosomal protein L11 methyltransferase [Metamycoplasma hominis]QKX37764.1 50S ribosomal protein L11 methyltransferase [Metamycoplasma hominis]QKX41103.1 50S ribosomal protein L11 methyltransferase [Metamycoplasma hominis]
MNNYKRFYDEKWNFKEGSMKDLVHGLHPYPAMMMPLICREMLNQYGKGSETVFLDPYVGSGTTLVEAQYYGAKKAYGVDLNPLAILISRTKTEEIDLKQIRVYMDSFDETISNISDDVSAPEFSIRDSWFNNKTIRDLAKITAFVNSIKDSTINDFFKISLSEVIRTSSETRNGEFKLYRMSKKALEKFNPEPIRIYKEVIERNYGILESINYKRNTDIILINESTLNLEKHNELNQKVDIIVTSPPYGDSHTTVAYGQFSRLANEWLGFDGAGSLDKRLLGGKKVQNKTFDIPELDTAIEKINEADKKFNRCRAWEVVAFYSDYEDSIKAVDKTVKNGGYVVYVVGNRRVRNIELPLDVITYKMFEKLGYYHVVTHVRDILNKRMPSKASPSNEAGEQIPTMTSEYIVVMKKN